MEKKEQMLSDIWDYEIHPILGYKWKQPNINPHPKVKAYEYDSY
jgi:hypothetical protein|tara:strand:+ start:669 stop:800 length:132 start_codon:yes stop_codon:yes gene_type:complete